MAIVPFDHVLFVGKFDVSCLHILKPRYWEILMPRDSLHGSKRASRNLQDRINYSSS